MGRCKYYVSPSRRIKNMKRLITHMKTRILILEQILCNKNEQSDIFIEQSGPSIFPNNEMSSVFPSNSVSSFSCKENVEQSDTLPISPLKMNNNSHPFCEEDNLCCTNSQSCEENDLFTNSFNSALFKMMDEKFEKHTLELQQMIKSEIT